MDPAGRPVIPYADVNGLALHINCEEIRVRPFPAAHTVGDGVVWITGSKELHLGDLFFNRRFPFVDLFSGGSVEGLARAIATPSPTSSPRPRPSRAKASWPTGSTSSATAPCA